MLDEIADYGHKARILRQIQSNKAHRYVIINAVQNIATVVLGSLLTFMGFAGFERISVYLDFGQDWTVDEFEAVFNFLVFGLFVIMMLHLVFRFAGKQAESERAIVQLSNFVNEVDDIVAEGHRDQSRLATSLQILQAKYRGLIPTLPANSDREYLKARKDLAKKRAKKAGVLPTLAELASPTKQQEIVAGIVQDSPIIMQVLATLRDLDSNLYLGGGLVRNAVWDSLHGYHNPTQFDDIDVVYWNPVASSKAPDLALEARLKVIRGNVHWSVKNQARMHTANQESAYSSLEDAIAKWPERCTAIAVRLDSAGALVFVAPHGFDDLLRLIVRPTPHFETKRAAYQARVQAKDWNRLWPRLLIL